MKLEDALTCVRAAGYRVTKPKLKKQIQVGPTCVVTFASGEVFRMTTYCPGDKLDYARGQKLCEAAWQSRHRHDPAFIPAVASVHFERNGERL